MFHLTIEKGKTVALVGQSGSGKTTLVDLLPRFWDVTEGQIQIDGTDIRELKITRCERFNGKCKSGSRFYLTIPFSIISLLALIILHSEEVIKAAKIANAHDFIMETRMGYDTSIGDRGSKLSGGQRQRLSIARAILKNPPILILDEATSALDTESERLVQDALENLMKNRTSLVIAHRLSTVKNADLICVFHNGKIVERGTHEN